MSDLIQLFLRNKSGDGVRTRFVPPLEVTGVDGSVAAICILEQSSAVVAFDEPVQILLTFIY